MKGEKQEQMPKVSKVSLRAVGPTGRRLKCLKLEEEKTGNRIQ